MKNKDYDEYGMKIGDNSSSYFRKRPLGSGFRH